MTALPKDMLYWLSLLEERAHNIFCSKNEFYEQQLSIGEHMGHVLVIVGGMVRYEQKAIKRYSKYLLCECIDGLITCFW